ncbi:MAG TPA: c-type cytochrome, partial [Gammaproteobacteria bacterium]|nr:c-type cytochrome [Gammaproteobacteria bacterium]
WLALCAGASVRAETRNPFENDEVAIRAGASLFAARCADCHGPDAKGRLGPDLTQRWTRGETDESAFLVVRNGVPGSSMPPNTAPDNEIWAIVAHLRSISVVPPLQSTGDANRGRAVFADACADCHQVRGQGGAFGPDLTSIGATRSRAALVTALRDPSATMALGFRAVTVRARGGSTTGVVKAEDAFSLQLVTEDGELRAFAKGELAELTRERESAMPVFGPERLSDAALEDLLSFLGTLRGASSR